MSSERRAGLLALKLDVLVRDHLGPHPENPRRFLGRGAVDDEVGSFPGGAAVGRGGEAWVLVEDEPARGLGGAMVWAARHGANAINLLAESSTGLLARRAAYFDPAPMVWAIEGRTIAPATGDPRPAPQTVAAAATRFIDIIERAGADSIVEHGVLAGEVAGLEICRVAVDDDGRARLELGVGAHDREAFALLHPPDQPVGPDLADLVATVREHRRPGAAPHALNRLGRERYLRWRLQRDPSLVGLVALRPAQPPVPRTSLKDAVPCVALGEDRDGCPAVVVCSTGIDLDLVPFAADARAAIAETEVEPEAETEAVVDARLILAVPVGDDHPATRLLASRLRRPAEVVAVPPDSPGAPQPAGRTTRTEGP